jgi:cytochrome c-type biogenesis protein CcmE
MKKTHIIGILVIVIAMAAIVSSISDSSTYANFDEAFAHPSQEYHVVGTLDRSEAITYNPSENPNLTVFTMVDKKGVKSTVYLNKSKPQDFERSESVVLIGKANENVFYANDILMKCPSKYDQDNKLDTSI